MRLLYSSLTTPASTIDVHTGTGARATKRVQPVLGGFDASDYACERLWAAAEDGTKVPVSLVYRIGARPPRGSPGPLLLNAYGSYEACSDASFSYTQRRLPLLDRGFAFAIAHVRGGGELGRAWYEDGKFGKKPNTFTDVVAAAEHLVAQGWTDAASMCLEGRSAGGLMVGAVLNLRPDLFQARQGCREGGGGGGWGAGRPAGGLLCPPPPPNTNLNLLSRPRSPASPLSTA